MAWYNNVFGSPKPVVLENVEGQSLPEDAKPISERTLEILDDPVDYRTLEKLYRRDSDTFAAINHIVKTFMSSAYSIKCKDANTKKWIEEFLYQARFDIVLRKIVLHTCIYGNAWVELVKNKKDKIVAFDHIDPKMMDFGRDSLSHILYDTYNNPQYYVQMLPTGMTLPDSKKDREIQQTSPRIRDTSGTGIKFFTDEVAHFTIWTVGDQLDGVGLIEPMWNALMAKIQIEKDWGVAMKKATSPLLIGHVGNDMHRPTKTSIDKMTTILRDATANSVTALPFPDTIEYVTAEIQSLEPHLGYYVDKVSAATGVPKPYIVGSGDQTPRSTFKGLNLGYERNIMEMQKNIAYSVERQIFRALCEQYNLKGDPILVFEPPSIEYMDSKQARLVEYANAGLLLPDLEVREIIRRMENLPAEPPGLEKKMEAKKAKARKASMQSEEQADEMTEVKKEAVGDDN